MLSNLALMRAMSLRFLLLVSSVGMAMSALIPLQAHAKGPEPVALDQVAAVELCRRYLSTEDEGERRALIRRIAGYSGDYQKVIDVVSQQTYRPIPPGYYPERRFGSPEAAQEVSARSALFCGPQELPP